MPLNRSSDLWLRTFSSDSRHVHKYTLGTQLTTPAQTSWFFQQFNELLGKIGEVKAIMVNGTIVTNMLCKPTEVDDAFSGQNELTEIIKMAHRLDSM